MTDTERLELIKRIRDVGIAFLRTEYYLNLVERMSPLFEPSYVERRKAEALMSARHMEALQHELEQLADPILKDALRTLLNDASAEALQGEMEEFFSTSPFRLLGHDALLALSDKRQEKLTEEQKSKAHKLSHHGEVPIAFRALLNHLDANDAHGVLFAVTGMVTVLYHEQTLWMAVQKMITRKRNEFNKSLLPQEEW